jgi:catalase (peroxidase I)
VLRQNADKVNPFDDDFDYATEFAKLDGKKPISRLTPPWGGILLTD